MVFKNIKKALGGKIRYMITGGDRFSPKVFEFL